MSLETLLDTLAEPSVPPLEGAEEPLETASAKVGSPGSPSSPEKTSTHDETLAITTRCPPITPTEVRDSLAPEDIEDWCKGDISTETLAAFVRSLMQRREMDQGKVPAHYTKRATCRHCGPVWLWFAGEVQGCPWCWNRAAGRPIPRPGQYAGSPTHDSDG